MFQEVFTTNRLGEVMKYIDFLKCVLWFTCIVFTLASTVGRAQVTAGPGAADSQSGPRWAEIISASALQNRSLISFQLKTAADIPHSSSTECAFEFILRPVEKGAHLNGHPTPLSKQVVRFDLSHWDGSPWFAMNILSYNKDTTNSPDTSRIFDWKLTHDTLRIRFSLDGLAWSSVQWFAQVSYEGKYVSRFPLSGFETSEIDSSFVEPIESETGTHSSFTFPSSFKAIMDSESIPLVVNRGYEYERDLTGILPVCGDTAAYVFNRYYDGAAIEGSPIGMGPGMWGTTAMWFVYFHELGHDFCNASARFRQLYPLTMGLPSGPLPANILFYEGWASLPAMYALHMIVADSSSHSIPLRSYESVKQAWDQLEKRFSVEWEKYKVDSSFAKINPDIIDGLFLELQHDYGWGFFKRFYALMRPQSEQLTIFDACAKNDSADLRITRSTLTVAIFSALAQRDLSENFLKWNFPLDRKLFDDAYSKLLGYLETERI